MKKVPLVFLVSISLFSACSTISTNQMSYLGEESKTRNVYGSVTHTDWYGIGVSGESYVREYNEAVSEAFMMAPENTVNLVNLKAFRQSRKWPQSLGSGLLTIGSTLTGMGIDILYYDGGVDPLYSIAGLVCTVLGGVLNGFNIYDFYVVGEPESGKTISPSASQVSENTRGPTQGMVIEQGAERREKRVKGPPFSEGKKIAIQGGLQFLYVDAFPNGFGNRGRFAVYYNAFKSWGIGLGGCGGFYGSPNPGFTQFAGPCIEIIFPLKGTTTFVSGGGPLFSSNGFGAAVDAGFIFRRFSVLLSAGFINTNYLEQMSYIDDYTGEEVQTEVVLQGPRFLSAIGFGYAF